VNGRAAARSGEWAQHFSNASCFITGFVAVETTTVKLGTDTLVVYMPVSISVFRDGIS